MPKYSGNILCKGIIFSKHTVLNENLFALVRGGRTVVPYLSCGCSQLVG